MGNQENDKCVVSGTNSGKKPNNGKFLQVIQTFKAILTDIQFWVPVIVLLLGLLLLFYVNGG
ncbi:MAG TPA: hypothetical protein QF753_11045 [Victivallales bacterium]|nr:hypothetical protein [Victivallales bacterium]